MLNDKELFISLFSFLFLVIIAFLLIFYFNEQNMSNYVYYTNCYSPVGDYNVEPGKTSNSILTTCGVDNSSLCCYTASSLKDAISYVQSNDGYKFSYNEKTKNICILDPTNTGYSNNDQSNIYTLVKHNITQDYKGKTKKTLNESFNTDISATPIDNKNLQPKNPVYNTVKNLNQ